MEVLPGVVTSNCITNPKKKIGEADYLKKN
jgi:hypothetical protein